MPLHPLAARFAAVAEVYDRARPGYPEPFATTLTAELGLAAGDRVLDLAAGTGKLTRALAAAGLEVSAVEPQERLRAILATHVPPERVHDGVAEAIPFPDGEFAAVTIADAFHWFDQQPALREIARVLRPGGGLALITAIPALPHEVGAALGAARTEHPFFDNRPWSETLAETPGWSAPRVITITTRQTLPVADYVRSMSWVDALDPPARDALLAQVPAEPLELDVRAIVTLSARA